MPAANTFSKTERLTKRKRIEQLMQQGQSFIKHPLRITYLKADVVLEAPVQVVIVVPKRKFAKAVDRNLLKRRIREAWRIHKKDLYEHLQKSNLQLLIMLVYVSAEKENFSVIEKKMTAAIQHIINET